MFPNHYAQYRYLSIVLCCWLLIFLVTRTVLLLTHLHEASANLPDLLLIFGIGLLYDLSFLVYAAVPLAVYLVLCPGCLWRRRGHRQALYIAFIVSLFLMLFTAVSEWLFWNEFGVRFNFISVDYLVYSDELIDNILESYPVYPVMTLLFLLAALSGYVLRHRVAAALRAPRLSHASAWASLAGLLLVAGLVTATVGQGFPRTVLGNVYQRELASNGPFQFFTAFRNNELDYPQFYATLPPGDAGKLMRQAVAESNTRFVSADPEDIRRVVDNPGPPRFMNVVLVTIESLSARYLGSFGNPDGLTPNLDELRRHSLSFENFYATGTRTTRGLEAVTLSIPPTPGRSIVKRIGRESGYASLGQQLRAVGYDSVFLYGGRGYFDNMNAFFAGNGYRVVDQSRIPDAEIHFTNAWGVCDEDLYTQTIKVADADYAQRTPFFLHVMTTSNHRPYTYPPGRIDIPSGDGRNGAVKYTDYAVGRFLAAARNKPWFHNTLFVFTADHTAGSAGKEDLPAANYHIPLFIYAPAFIEPREFRQIASQIDIAPVLLGLLNVDYVSTFFGRNVLRDEFGPERALIANYQHLGLLEYDSLAILSPRKVLRRHEDARALSYETEADIDDSLIRRDIAYYQVASYMFGHGLLD